MMSLYAKIVNFIAILYLVGSSDASLDWMQLGNDIDGEGLLDQLGWSVSLSNDGSTVAVGAPGNDADIAFGADVGRVQVFNNSTGNWIQVGANLPGVTLGGKAGNSVSLSANGNIVAIGAPGSYVFEDNGYVLVFQFMFNTWIPVGDIILGMMSESLGASVSLSADGNILAVGAPYYWESGKAGLVRVYEIIENTWTQIGSDIVGNTIDDDFGHCVSLSANGDMFAVGARNNDENGEKAGQAQVYRNINGTWTQIGSDINGGSPGDRLGSSIALSADGTTLAVGASETSDIGIDIGKVHLYNILNNSLAQIGNAIKGKASYDEFGTSVSLSNDGKTVAIGAVGIDSGRVVVYQNDNNNWVQVGSDITGEFSTDRFGRSVSISADGTVLAVGANENDANNVTTIDGGHVRVLGLYPSEMLPSSMPSTTPSKSPSLSPVESSSQLPKVPKFTLLFMSFLIFVNY